MRTTCNALLAAMLWFFFVSGAATSAAADDGAASPPGQTQLDLGGYIQFWWTALEQTENGLRQPFTNDTAARETSGFSIRRARFSVNFTRKKLAGRLSIRLEGGTPSLQDAHVHYPLAGSLVELWAGQMKIPSVYEVADPGHGLDFLSRTNFAGAAVDFSLCKSPPGGAPDFADAGMANRDLGLAFKGTGGGAEYFVMLGNGFGANRFIGGREHGQDILANDPGNMFYSGRASYAVLSWGDTAPSSLRAGGHVSWNHHSDVVLEDEETVLDIKRLSWSADLRARFAGLFTFTAMYGEGRVEDDYNNDCLDDYRYRGWELKAMSASFYNGFNCGFRYDGFAGEENESGPENTLHSYVLGINYERPDDIRFQVNYKWNVLDSETDRDIADDLLYLCTQFSY